MSYAIHNYSWNHTPNALSNDVIKSSSSYYQNLYRVTNGFTVNTYPRAHPKVDDQVIRFISESLGDPYIFLQTMHKLRPSESTLTKSFDFQAMSRGEVPVAMSQNDLFDYNSRAIGNGLSVGKYSRVSESNRFYLVPISHIDGDPGKFERAQKYLITYIFPSLTNAIHKGSLADCDTIVYSRNFNDWSWTPQDPLKNLELILPVRSSCNEFLIPADWMWKAYRGHVNVLYKSDVDGDHEFLIPVFYSYPVTLDLITKFATVKSFFIPNLGKSFKLTKGDFKKNKLYGTEGMINGLYQMAQRRIDDGTMLFTEEDSVYDLINIYVRNLGPHSSGSSDDRYHPFLEIIPRDHKHKVNLDPRPYGFYMDKPSTNKYNLYAPKYRRDARDVFGARSSGFDYGFAVFLPHSPYHSNYYLYDNVMKWYFNRQVNMDNLALSVSSNGQFLVLHHWQHPRTFTNHASQVASDLKKFYNFIYLKNRQSIENFLYNDETPSESHLENLMKTYPRLTRKGIWDNGLKQDLIQLLYDRYQSNENITIPDSIPINTYLSNNAITQLNDVISRFLFPMTLSDYQELLAKFQMVNKDDIYLIIDSVKRFRESKKVLNASINPAWDISIEDFTALLLPFTIWKLKLNPIHYIHSLVDVFNGALLRPHPALGDLELKIIDSESLSNYLSSVLWHLILYRLVASAEVTNYTTYNDVILYIHEISLFLDHQKSSLEKDVYMFIHEVADQLKALKLPYSGLKDAIQNVGGQTFSPQELFSQTERGIQSIQQSLDKLKEDIPSQYEDIKDRLNHIGIPNLGDLSDPYGLLNEWLVKLNTTQLQWANSSSHLRDLPTIDLTDVKLPPVDWTKWTEIIQRGLVQTFEKAAMSLVNAISVTDSVIDMFELRHHMVKYNIPKIAPNFYLCEDIVMQDILLHKTYPNRIRIRNGGNDVIANRVPAYIKGNQDL